MKKLVVTCAMVAAFVWAGIVQGGRPLVPPVKPFVSISVTPDRIDLGTVPFGDIHDASAEVTVKVQANCPHGPIVVSATPFRQRGAPPIPPKRISVKAPATGGYVTMAKPVAISKPTAGSHDIVVNIKVQSGLQDPAGEYKGTLIFTVMPP